MRVRTGDRRSWDDLYPDRTETISESFSSFGVNQRRATSRQSAAPRKRNGLQARAEAAQPWHEHGPCRSVAESACGDHGSVSTVQHKSSSCFENDQIGRVAPLASDAVAESRTLTR